MQTSKYLLATERDAEWGLTISTVGREEIAPGEEYPTKGHADGFCLFSALCSLYLADIPSLNYSTDSASMWL